MEEAEMKEMHTRQEHKKTERKNSQFKCKQNKQVLSNTSHSKIYIFCFWVLHFIRPCNWDGGSSCLCHAVTAAAQMEAKGVRKTMHRIQYTEYYTEM